MLSELLKKKSLFSHLYTIDKNIAEQYRQKPCPICGGPLYYANYPRKPRGEPDGLPEEYFIRFSLCCGNEGCRHRLMPPSCRFLGKKVYWHIVILVVVFAWQAKTVKTNIFKLAKLFDISRNTIGRWIYFYQDVFPSSRQWKKIRGMVTASIKNDELPAGLIRFFLRLKSSAEDAIISCLKFLSQGAGFFKKIRAD